jgi:hypothetical protein
MASTVAMTLAPGWRCTFRMMAGASPLAAPFTPVHAPRRSFSEPSMTRATSFRRTGAPFT